MYYHRPPAIEARFRGDTDKSKRLYAELQVEYFRAWSDYDQHGYAWSFQPEFKASRRFSFDYAFGVERMFNDIGFSGANQTDGIVLFGKRDISTLTNTLSGAFIFSASSYLTLRVRHYWSRADYGGSYYVLQDDGSLNQMTNTGMLQNDDVNTNYLNLDLVYTWRFAPGSELSVVWKNAIYSEGDIVIRSAMDNFSDLLSMPQTNSISLKILYYLDYQNFRKLFSSK